MTEWLVPEACVQWHKVQLEDRHQWCNPRVDTGSHSIQPFMTVLDDGTEGMLSKLVDDRKLGGVLVLDGIELVFFIVASMGLCFGFVRKTVLLTQGCFSHC